MSGICGVWSFDGRRPELEPVLALLERRGPDGTHLWGKGSVVLGHTLLATTPESLVEVLPLADEDSGCTITADARIDNREELITALELTAQTRSIGDGELILRAYLQWGEQCPKHMLGDFAFAIWDPRSNHLFCARDHLGMRQFNYHFAPGNLFAFASEAEAIIAHPLISDQLDEGRVADALENLEGFDFTSSFYNKVLKLPPAHSLTIGSAMELTISRYWTLKPPRQLHLDSDDAYAKAFLEIFTEAVRSRLRSARPVGAMLSGGMDSGSVAAIAAELLKTQGSGPLVTYSAVGPDPVACIETRTIQVAAKAITGIDPHFINYAELQCYRSDLLGLWDGSHPFDSHMTLIRSIYLAANRQGLNVVLDGVGGDVVLSGGNAVARLLRRGRVRRAWREAKAEERFWGPSWAAPKVFLVASWTTFAPRPIRILRRKIMPWLRQRFTTQHGLVAPEFATRVDLRSRRKRFTNLNSDRGQSDAQRLTEAIQHPHTAAANERYDRVASALAVERRDPFLDLRVISFCLSLPSSQLQANGWPKIVLRRAMHRRLPEAVLWRRGKEHLGWNFTLSLITGWDRWPDVFESEADRAPPFVVVPFRHSEPSVADTETKIRLLSFLRWIRHR